MCTQKNQCYLDRYFRKPTQQPRLLTTCNFNVSVDFREHPCKSYLGYACAMFVCVRVWLFFSCLFVYACSIEYSCISSMKQIGGLVVSEPGEKQGFKNKTKIQRRYELKGKRKKFMYTLLVMFRYMYICIFATPFLIKIRIVRINTIQINKYIQYTFKSRLPQQKNQQNLGHSPL